MRLTPYRSYEHLLSLLEHCSSVGFRRRLHDVSNALHSRPCSVATRSLRHTFVSSNSPTESGFASRT